MPRKPWNDDKGKHEEKPHAPNTDIFDGPVADIWSVVCEICDAQPGKPCHSIMGMHKEKTYPHHARVIAARMKLEQSAK